MRTRICDPDRHQNLIISSLAHCQLSLKISCKSIWKFLHKAANKQTDRQTNGGKDEHDNKMNTKARRHNKQLADKQLVSIFI